MHKLNSSMENRRLFVSHKDESVRMFENSFLDYCSRVKYWVPMALYIPVVILFSILSFTYYKVTLVDFAVYFGGGLFIWTIFEYIMHRFVFHHEPKTELGKRIHFISHGVHHDYPNDSTRLVMPPGISIPLALLFYVLGYWILGEALTAPAFAGFVIGYVFYDTLHYTVHYYNWSNPWFQAIKKHHMRHHYQDPEHGFGFTSKFWDHIFRTDFRDKEDYKPNSQA